MKDRELIADMYEILEKFKEARDYYYSIPVFFRKPFMAIFKTTKNFQEAKETTEFLMKREAH